MFSPLIFLFILSTLKQEPVFVQGHRVYNEVYKKDFSEYCRRKVVPSVFLGRKVVEAYSQILHFSKLELPYSCFISVRSESGSNIILVIEFSSHKSLMSSCSKDADQLLVYEMGETYGGYWGPLADNVINQDIKNHTKYYTIKTTPSLEAVDSSIESDNEYTETSISTERITTLPENSPTQSVDYIEEEVPIVNVSGFLSPGVKLGHAIDIDSIFDAAYDVSIGSGISSDTTILPLIQFSAINEFDARRYDDVAKYHIHYNITSLPMYINSIYPKTSTSKKRKLYRKYKYNSNKLLNLKPNDRIFESMQTMLNLPKFTNRKQLTTISGLGHATRRVFTLTSKFSPTRFNREKTFSWDLIDTLLESLNKTSKWKTNEESATSESMSQLLRKISEMKHNFSVYLSPNLSAYMDKSKVISSQDYFTRIPTSINASFYQLNPISGNEISLSQVTTPTLIIGTRPQAIGTVSSENFTETNFNDSLQTKSLHTFNNNVTSENHSNIRFSELKHLNNRENILLKDTYNNFLPPDFNYTNPLRGALVNRESWENVVQIAPVMVDILNIVNSSRSETMKINNIRRKKKHINPISTDMAKPHKKSSRKEMGSTTTGSYNEVDMHEFAELVELQDDEMQGRVALRYLRRYVGPVLFNVCDYEEALSRHVYLFNSSRIILAISNFTIETMALVVTPARTLLTSDERCTSAQFECQVSGARVCIDSLTACDGVPNCGSYDVYDEDRLLCGGAIGLQHNVYLAAITFFAVLLTLLYTVNYWLKRCVPKVSDAFFIYTEGLENVLYLDSIMRNPNDDDDNSKAGFQSNILEVDLLCPSVQDESNKKRILKAIKRILILCSCFLCRGKNNDKSQNNIYSSPAEPKRIYSFTELEIQKMLRNNINETGVQTGESLEMAPLNKSIENYDNITNDKSQNFNKADSLLFRNNSSLNISLIRKQKNNPDELSIMKFFNDSKSNSNVQQQSNTMLKISTSNVSSTMPEEKEIQSHVYEQQNQNIAANSAGGVILANIDIHKENASSTQTKHLRFEEGATIIPNDYYNDNDDVDKTDQRRSVVLGTRRSKNTKNLDAIEEIHEQGSSGNRDYIRFWSKSKRSKKPHP